MMDWFYSRMIWGRARMWAAWLVMGALALALVACTSQPEASAQPGENGAGLVTVRFSGRAMEGLAWEYGPTQAVVQAQVGETYRTAYRIKNLAERPVTAHADRHIYGPEAYLTSLEILGCFCFIHQTLQPGEEVEFPVWFTVKEGLPKGVGEFHVEFLLYPIERWQAHDHPLGKLPVH